MPSQQPAAAQQPTAVQQPAAAQHLPSRRSVLRTSVAAGAVGVTGASATSATAASADAPASASRPARRSRRGSSGVRLRWLGIAGWELAFDGHRLLVDPYLTRQPYTGPDGKGDMTRALEVDHRIIDRVLREHLEGAPEFVLLTHGHWDHLADVPYLLDHPSWRDEEINVLGAETHLHLLTAMGVPGKGRGHRLVVVSGGEVLRHPLQPSGKRPRPDYTIEVFRSLHSQLGGYGFDPYGTLTAPPSRPRTLGDLVEGGTLGYQVTVGDRLSVMFLSGTANFAAREVSGAAPDVLVLGASGHAAVHDYVERAVSALGRPRVVVPSHHDDMVTALDDPAVHGTVNRQAVERLRQVVGAAGHVVDPRHLEQFEL
ncbi:MBL fold metallo-hydrolase [Streptomyces albus subsp. chlorinus]|uniref:MBL fold metallo-hydrolase n=1 Tax=Streptomyces albus TaxID=1888 RepID=UPI0015700FF6|nr:MBL fold metallo-hydrolase [Streptomyces albus]NSC20016.1 MBL fold metallo-hydrolase [Streptomyces albus subsp. chlorinus]